MAEKEMFLLKRIYVSLWWPKFNVTVANENAIDWSDYQQTFWNECFLVSLPKIIYH